MKVIISPAKIQNSRGFIGYEKTPLIFEAITDKIKKELNDYSSKDLSKIMKIKGDLLQTTYDYIHLNESAYPAIDLYNGLVFKELNIFSYDAYQLDYLEGYLRILSAQYGVLKPSTGIKPYRLDFTMSLKKLNLKKLWLKPINQYFEDELILNLASKEFSSLIKAPMINIHFKEETSDGRLKIVTVRAKMARGLMLNYMVENTIEDLNLLKNFKEMGYVYHEKLSSDMDWVFLLPYE